MFTAIFLLCWLSCLLCSVFLVLYIFFQCDLRGVITVFMNVIILAFMLTFYYFISKKVSHLCLSSYLFHFFSLPADFNGIAHFSHILPLLSLSRLLFPPLRAEEPQCLLLTFSYHLSPFHHHHYLPFLSSTPGSPFLPLLSSTPFVCFSLISILPLLQTGKFSNPQPTFILHNPNTSFYLLSITAAWFLLYLSVCTFDHHEIRALLEIMNMKKLSFKGRMWNNILVGGLICGISA